MEERETDFPSDDLFAPAYEETRGFAPDEMVACARCSRHSAPTRTSCLYCGAPLPITEASAPLRRPELRPLESWERGLNVILLPEPKGEVTRETIAEAAVLLKTEAGRLREIVVSRRALPVARAASDEEAALIENRLGALGLSVEIISDELLAAESAPPVRVRKLEIAGDLLKGTAAGEVAHEIAWRNVVLISAGRIFTKRVEVEGRSTLGKRTAEAAEAREIVSDEAALEIYARCDARGWRIMANGFDYSCLGEMKALLARENFVRLAEVLRAQAPSAKFDDEYGRVRHLLASVWPLDERTESGGLRRTRPGRFNTGTATVLTNDAQFTRYARLRYRFELKRRDGQH